MPKPDPRSARRLDRRRFLGAGAALAATSMLPGASLLRAASALRADAPRLTQHVVFVAFAGGVRTKETWRSGNTPNLDRIAASGVVMPKVATRNIGHFAAVSAILTGSYDVYGIRENAHPNAATVFERARKAAGLDASQVWLSTTGAEQETNLAFSNARGFGAEYGANQIGGEAVFNEDFRDLVVGMDEPPRVDPEREHALRRLRGGVATPLPVEGVDGASLNDPRSAAMVEAYILQELQGKTAALTGLGAEDAKALHVARGLLTAFQPKLLVVTLNRADVAHGSFNDYVSVIKRNDDELGKLFDAILADPLLRDTTSVFVMPEFGRDRDFNARRGLDHGDASKELQQVALVAWGPDFHSGRVDDTEIDSLDLAPTMLDLLGVDSGGGQRIKQLYA